MEPISTFIQLALSAALSTTTIDSATASYQYDPNTSQVEACKRAEERAKVKILEKRFGQTFGSDQSMSCREAGDKHSCSSLTNTFETTHGYIRAIKDRTENVEPWKCTVKVTAEVDMVKPTKSRIDASALLDRVVYNQDETAKVTVKTNYKGNVTVFRYDPVDDVVTKVFPEANNRYSNFVIHDQPLVVQVSNKGLVEREQPYHYFVIVTDAPVNLIDQYRLHNFYKMYDNLYTQDKHLVRKSFTIARSKL